MGSYDDLVPGTVFEGPSVVVPEDVLDLVRGLGGYTHPIFNDVEHVRDHTPFDDVPVPGTLILFLLGGLAEQTGRFDDTTVALIGMDDTRFLEPAFPGDEVRLTMEVVGREPTSSGRHGTVQLRWTAHRSDGDRLCDTVATFLFRRT